MAVARAGEQRRTVQKEAVRQALQETPGFISAQDLHRSLNEAGSTVGLATVYRQLNALAEAGDADTVSLPQGQLFRSCNRTEHHHHLICENCGNATEISPPQERWFQDIAEAHGFTITHHLIEVFGLCQDCRATDGD